MLQSDKVSAIVASLENANSLLVNKEFEKCLSVSLEQLNIIRRNDEIKSLTDAKNALCEVTVQAYAELDRWQEVLPFVSNVYSSLEAVPAQIIQLCILLHASVKDYITCAALANVWLRSPQNTGPEQETKYLETIDVYTGHVLIPSNRWDDIQAFLENCPGLKTHRRNHFMKTIRALQHQVDQLNVETIELAEGDTDTLSRNTKTASDPTKSGTVSKSSDFTTYVHYVSQWVSKYIPIVTLDMIKHISLMALLLYILIFKTDIALLSSPALAKIWLLIMSLWKRMFAPFHQAKS